MTLQSKEARSKEASSLQVYTRPMSRSINERSKKEEQPIDKVIPSKSQAQKAARSLARNVNKSRYDKGLSKPSASGIYPLPEDEIKRPPETTASLRHGVMYDIDSAHSSGNPYNYKSIDYEVKDCRSVGWTLWWVPCTKLHSLLRTADEEILTRTHHMHCNADWQTPWSVEPEWQPGNDPAGGQLCLL